MTQDVVPVCANRISMKQEDFAGAFGFTINQIKDWEQNRTRPLGGVRAYLMLIERNPDAVLEMLRTMSKRKKAA